MGIYYRDNRYTVTYTRRGERLNYSCKTLEEAQAKLHEMTNETIVELTHRRYYFHDKRIMVLHYPRLKRQSDI
jgi:hypothetical protein